MESLEGSALSQTTCRIHAQWMLLLLLLMQQVHPTGASCNEEEVDRCRQAAMKESLMDLKSGGRCQAQSYSVYTHNCFLNTYDPEVDHCCCPLASKVLCCSYHQSGTHFRCNENEDVAAVGHSIPAFYMYDSITVTGALGPAASSNRSQEVSVSVWIAIAVGCLVGVVLLAGIAACAWRRLRHRRKTLQKKKQQQLQQQQQQQQHINQHHHPHQQHHLPDFDEAMPLSAFLESETNEAVTEPASNGKVLFYMPSQSETEGPTAPPDMEGAESDDVFPMHCDAPGCARRQVEPPSYSRSVSYPDGEHQMTPSSRPRFHSCASCPPPSYDEHHNHRVIP